MKNKRIASLHPDLIIVSFGTNEAHSRRYLAQAHKMQIGRLLGMLKAACPEAAFFTDYTSRSIRGTSSCTYH